MIKRIRICQSVVVSLIGIILLFGNTAQASGDRRVVQPPQLSQPVCTTLTPEANQSSTSVQRRLQQALNRCPAGQAVRLISGPQGNTFQSGPLQIPSGVFLRLDAGSVLLADNNPRLYDTGQGRCGTIDQKGNGCRAFIAIVNSAGGGIEGEGTIDGQGGERMAGQNETWWEMARRAQSVTKGRQNAPRLIQIDHSHNIVIYGVRLRNAPNFHIVLNHVQGATIWGVIIDTPATARNTDGIDPGASQDVTITHSFIRTGDDNIAIKAGSGPSQHISITDNHFYSGHGMSIGSEVNAGVSDVLVHNLTLDGTTSGLRIKSDASRGGVVSDIQYSHICMRNNRWPVSFDTHYSPTASGTSLPEYRNIILRDVHASGDRPATVILRGYDASHPLMVRMDGVTFSPGTKWITEFARLTSGANGIQPAPPGTISPTAPHYSPIDCADQWVPFPASAALPSHAGSSSGNILSVGKGQPFSSVQAAINAAVPGDTITIMPGTYREVVHLNKQNVRLTGTGARPDDVVIESDHSAGDSGGTSHSATFYADADNIELANLSIVNRFQEEHPDQRENAQAVALSASGDNQRFSHLHLISYQDTLYAGSRGCQPGSACGPSRQYYQDDRIDGAVDVIFGSALAYFDHVTLMGVKRADVVLTAQGRSSMAEKSGFYFHDCTVTADPSVERISLGRPWRPFATVSYVGCTLDKRVLPERFTEWQGKHWLTSAHFTETASARSGS